MKKHDGSLFQIGEVVKLLGVTRKALLVYEEKGLLTPAVKDEESGYRYGTPGQSWRTATTQWVVRALVHFVFGLKADLDGICLDPCLPPDWENAKITKRFRGATYEIVYRQPKGAKGEIDRITVNGQPLEGIRLPCDGESTYRIEVFLK